MKKSNIESITPAQAHYVLSQMARDRKIGQRDIDHYLNRMKSEINDLEARLDALREIAPSKGAARTAARSTGSARTASKPKRKPPTITPEVAASRALQGRYISMVKRFPKNARGKYKKIAQTQGREEAIKKMEAALKK